MDRQAVQVELFVIEGHQPMSAASLPELLAAIEHDDDCESSLQDEHETSTSSKSSALKLARYSEPFPLISGASQAVPRADQSFVSPSGRDMTTVRPPKLSSTSRRSVASATQLQDLNSNFCKLPTRTCWS
jgi:hypothetical protein